MIAATGLRWILTILFTVLALYGVWRGVAARTSCADQGRVEAVASRVAHLLHAVMALAMGAMVWPWGMDLPALPQAVFFSLAALWFLVAAVLRRGGTTGGHAVLGSLPHVLVMAAMAWMVQAMGSAMGAVGSAGGAAMADMPGMDMSGGTGTATMTLSGTGPRTVAGLLALVLLALAMWWLARGFDLARAESPPRGGERAVPAAGEHGAYDLACHGAMALGMAVMFVVMV